MQADNLSNSAIYLVNKASFVLMEQTQQLFKYLLVDEHVCLRCIFRIYSFQSLSFYRDSSFYIQLVSKLVGQENLKKYCVSQFAMTPICWLCQGILQKSYIGQVSEKVIAKIKERGTTGMTKYKLNVKVPNVMSIKYNTFIHKAYQQLATPNPQKIDILNKILLVPLIQNKILQIKTVVKWLISAQLNNKHQLLLESTINEDQYTIIITIDQNYINVDYENEIMGLFRSDFVLGNTRKPHKKVKPNNEKPDMKCTQANISRIIKMNHKQIIYILNDCKDLKSILRGQGMKNFETQVAVSSQNIYLCGKYIKYSRYLSQTPWIIGGKRLTESSLQQEIQNKIWTFFYPGKTRDQFETKFHSGGREDIDVRMLHGGRPFVLQFVSPIIRLQDIPIQTIQLKLPLQLRQKVRNQTNNLTPVQRSVKYLQAIINDDEKFVQVRQLNQCTVDYISIQLKAAEADKIKHYLCYIKTKKPLTKQDKVSIQSIRNLKVLQKTPLRVLHRRTLMIRQKYVYRMIMHQVSECSGVVQLWASAGTYIKQFVHGDLNRTRPNLGEIIGGKEVDILQLDVGGLKEGNWDQQDLDNMKLPKLEWQQQMN